MKDAPSTRPYRMRARQAAVEATRNAILQAGADLWLERGYDDVTLDAVAERAGVTRQTVIRHFETKEGLVVAVTEWYGPQVEATRASEPGDMKGAIRRLVDEYETMGDANIRMLELEDRVDAMRAALERGRKAHRAWIERTFSTVLPSAGRPREQAVLTLYAATDVTVWKLLRRDLGQSRDITESTMVHLVEGALRVVGTNPKEHSND